MQELLYLKMWKDMALLDRKLLKICRSAFYGTPGIVFQNTLQHVIFQHNIALLLWDVEIKFYKFQIV